MAFDSNDVGNRAMGRRFANAAFVVLDVDASTLPSAGCG
jgi:hypothetical protein